MKPTFAAASVAMADAFAGLHRDAFSDRHERAWSAAEFSALLASPGCFGLLASVGGTDAGLALVRTVADEAELLSIGVASGHRRQGVGGGLLTCAIAACAARGVGALFLEVAADNQAALGLYRSSGFGVVGRRAGYFPRGDGPAVDGLTMRADLPSDDRHGARDA